MTKTEFKTTIDAILNQFSRYQTHSDRERKSAEQIREHDPKLADLLVKNIDAANEVYEYVFSKTEKK